jgi:hypothetical protein
VHIVASRPINSPFHTCLRWQVTLTHLPHTHNRTTSTLPLSCVTQALWNRSFCISVSSQQLYMMLCGLSRSITRRKDSRLKYRFRRFVRSAESMEVYSLWIFQAMSKFRLHAYATHFLLKILLVDNLLTQTSLHGAFDLVCKIGTTPTIVKTKGRRRSCFCARHEGLCGTEQKWMVIYTPLVLYSRTKNLRYE